MLHGRIACLAGQFALSAVLVAVVGFFAHPGAAFAVQSNATSEALGVVDFDGSLVLADDDDVEGTSGVEDPPEPSGPDEPAEPVEVLTGQFEADLYAPKSAFSRVPTVVWKANASDADSLFSAAGASERAQVVEVRVVRDEAAPEGVRILSADGSVVYDCAFGRFVHALEPFAVPAFVIDDESGSALAELGATYGLGDAFVVGTSSAIAEVREACPTVVGMLDCSEWRFVNDEYLSEQVRAANECGARGIVFAEGVLDADDVRFVQSRLVGVWMDMGVGHLDTAATHDALMTGASGLVLGDYAGFYDLLGRYTAQRSITAYPSIVGHRGTKLVPLSGCQENTIGAFEWAIEQGARCIETDVWLVGGRLVVSHAMPSTANGLLGLDAVLERFAQGDVVLNVELKCDSTWTVQEQKAYAQELVARVQNAIESHPGVSGNVVFTTSFAIVLEQLQRAGGLRGCARAYLAMAGAVSLGDVAKRLAARDALSRMTVAARADYGALYDALALRCLALGSQVTNNGAFDADITSGSPVVSTDSANRSANYVASVSLAEAARAGAAAVRSAYTHELLQLDCSSFVQASAQNGGSPEGVDYSLVSLDDGLSKSGGTYRMDAPETLVCVACTQTMASGLPYTLYSPAFALHALDVSHSDAVTVQWRGAGDVLLAQADYYAVESADGAFSINPVPAYEGAEPTHAPSKKSHFTFAGWKSSATGATYADSFPRLSSDMAGSTVVYSAKFDALAHDLGPAATCTTSQKCLTCGHVVESKLGHSYRAGMCTRCGKATAASRVKGLSLESGPGWMLATWGGVEGADGYEVSWRVKGASEWKSAHMGKDATSCKLRSLKGKRKYQVRVRALVKANGEQLFGKWSARKTLKCTPGDVSGAKAVVGGATYRIISNTAATAAFVKAPDAKKVTVPAKVNVNGKAYRVVRVCRHAFGGTKARTVVVGKNVKVLKRRAFAQAPKLKTVVLKTQLLERASMKRCLAGSKVKVVIVPKAHKASYTELFKKRICGKKVRVKS